MRKTLATVVIVLLLLVVSTGSALAAWGFELVKTSPTTFDLTYQATAGETVVTNGYLICLNDINNVGAGWTGVHNCGALNNTACGDHPAPPIEVAVGSQSPAPGTTLTLNDDYLIATLTAPVAADLGFDSGNMFFQVFNATGGLLVTGATMEAGGNDSGGNPTFLSPGGGGPAPPIPEIITIVLISMGLVTLGVYVWYRRRRAVSHAQVVA